MARAADLNWYRIDARVDPDVANWKEPDHRVSTHR